MSRIFHTVEIPFTQDEVVMMTILVSHIDPNIYSNDDAKSIIYKAKAVVRESAKGN